MKHSNLIREQSAHPAVCQGTGSFAPAYKSDWTRLALDEDGGTA